MLWISASATSGEWPRMVDHWSLGISLVLWPTRPYVKGRSSSTAGHSTRQGKVEGRLRSRVGGAATSRGIVTHVAHVQAVVQCPGGLAAQVDERGILGPSLPGVAKSLETRRIRIDHLDRAQLSAEPGRDPAGLEPRRPENSVRAHSLVLPTARGNSS